MASWPSMMLQWPEMTQQIPIIQKGLAALTPSWSPQTRCRAKPQRQPRSQELGGVRKTESAFTCKRQTSGCFTLIKLIGQPCLVRSCSSEPHGQTSVANARDHSVLPQQGCQHGKNPSACVHRHSLIPRRPQACDPIGVQPFLLQPLQPPFPSAGVPGL